MKKMILLGALVLSTVALAVTGFNQGFWSLSQAAASGAAPTLATDGMPLDNLKGFRPAVCSDSGNLTGSGSLLAWCYVRKNASGTSMAWMRNPALDLPVTASGTPCQVFPDMESVGPFGRVYFQASGVGISAGTNVTPETVGALK